MTAVAVVAIQQLWPYLPLIWPSIKVNILNSTKCAQALLCLAVNGVSECES